MEVVIVVVFDDGKAELIRKCEKAQASLGRQQDRGRELVMRRQIDATHALCAACLLQIVETQTLFIDTHGRNMRTVGEKCLTSGRITQGLKHHRSEEHTSELQSH